MVYLVSLAIMSSVVKNHHGRMDFHIADAKEHRVFLEKKKKETWVHTESTLMDL